MRVMVAGVLTAELGEEDFMTVRGTNTAAQRFDSNAFSSTRRHNLMLLAGLASGLLTSAEPAAGQTMRGPDSPECAAARGRYKHVSETGVRALAGAPDALARYSEMMRLGGEQHVICTDPRVAETYQRAEDYVRVSAPKMGGLSGLIRHHERVAEDLDRRGRRTSDATGRTKGGDSIAEMMREPAEIGAARGGIEKDAEHDKSPCQRLLEYRDGGLARMHASIMARTEGDAETLRIMEEEVSRLTAELPWTGKAAGLRDMHLAMVAFIGDKYIGASKVGTNAAGSLLDLLKRGALPSTLTQPKTPPSPRESAARVAQKIAGKVKSDLDRDVENEVAAASAAAVAHEKSAVVRAVTEFLLSLTPGPRVLADDTARNAARSTIQGQLTKLREASAVYRRALARERADVTYLSDVVKELDTVLRSPACIAG